MVYPHTQGPVVFMSCIKYGSVIQIDVLTRLLILCYKVWLNCHIFDVLTGLLFLAIMCSCNVQQLMFNRFCIPCFKLRLSYLKVDVLTDLLFLVLSYD